MAKIKLGEVLYFEPSNGVHALIELSSLLSYCALVNSLRRHAAQAAQRNTRCPFTYLFIHSIRLELAAHSSGLSFSIISFKSVMHINNNGQQIFSFPFSASFSPFLPRTFS